MIEVCSQAQTRALRDLTDLTNDHADARLKLFILHGAARETLESVSSCTRFSGFFTISSFSFNRKPLELKIGRHVLWDSSNVRT